MALRMGSVWRHASLFTSSVLVSSAVSGLVGLAIARLLAPAIYGVFQTIQVLWQFGPYAGLGTTWALQQEMVRYESTQRPAEAARAQDVTFTFTVISSLVLTAALVLAAWRFSWPFEVGLTAIVAAVLLGRQVYSLCLAALTARSRFWVAGRGDVVTSLINLLCSAPLTYRFGLDGLLVAQLLWPLLGTAVLMLSGGLRLHWQIDWRRLDAQVRVGLQFAVNGLLQVSVKNTGRLVILATAGTVALGFYGVALLVAGYAELTGAAIGRSLIPTVVGAFEQRRRSADIRQYVVRSSKLLGSLLPVLTGVGVLTLPLLIRLILPRYSAGILPAQILVYGANFLLLRYGLEPFFVAVSELYRTFLIQAIAIALGAGGALLAMAYGYGLAGVAASTSLSYALISSGLLWSAHRHFAAPPLDHITFVVSVNLPACYCGLVVLWLANTIAVPATPTWSAAAALLGQIFGYLVLCIPVLARAERLGRFIKRIKHGETAN